MTERLVRLSMALLFVGVLLTAVGCDEISRDKYEMVKEGMDKETVKIIMKVKPSAETKDTILYLPEPGKGPLRVEFEFDKNGKLTKKEWLTKDNL